jgi:hypothetical protein
VLPLTNATLGGIGGTNITFYFRAPVTVGFNPSAPGNVVRAISYFDDGGVIYANGSEQVRFNLTNSPVALNYTNLAIVASTEGNGGLVTSNLLGLVVGNNLIAVEVHQNSVTSSDIAWGMQLEAFVTSFSGPVTGPRLNISRNLATGQVTVSWTGGGTLQETSALPASGAAGWSDVPGNPNPYVFTPVPGQNRFFSLRQ